jgi:hypothetical protein
MSRDNLSLFKTKTKNYYAFFRVQYFLFESMISQPRCSRRSEVIYLFGLGCHTLMWLDKNKVYLWGGLLNAWPDDQTLKIVFHTLYTCKVWPHCAISYVVPIHLIEKISNRNLANHKQRVSLLCVVSYELSDDSILRTFWHMARVFRGKILLLKLISKKMTKYFHVNSLHVAKCTQNRVIWKLIWDDTQERNPLLVIGKIAVGDFLDQMNWHDIRDRTVGSNLTGVQCVKNDFQGLIIWPSI